MPNLTLREEIENRIREMLKSPSIGASDIFILSKACVMLTNANAIQPRPPIKFDPEELPFSKRPFYYTDYATGSDQTSI